eukprot:Colp12_sorted_trinity150504_noHs@25682
MHFISTLRCRGTLSRPLVRRSAGKMKAFGASVLALVAFTIAVGAAPAPHVKYLYGGANQVHLALGAKSDEVTVTWSTPLSASSEARFGLSDGFPSNAMYASGIEKIFVDNGTLHHTQYIHRVTLRPLKELQTYTYQVRNGTEWSREFTFVAPGNENWNPRVAVFGDFGLANPRAFPALLADLKDRETDFIVHVGDFAYDMYRDNATYGDAWFNFVEPVYGNEPVMTCPGNHEGMYDFLNYRSRFTMPMFEQTQNLFFSFNAGTTHWIAYDTEVYFVYEAMTEHGGVHRNFGPYPELARRQLEFIEADLIEANKQRHVRPWIFAYGHRPFYCSNGDDSDCQKPNAWRTELEQLFHKYGVDIIFEGHQHSYERLWPTSNGIVLNGTDPMNPYHNPRAPIHIITGAAGCEEDLSEFPAKPLAHWSAVRISDYGFGRVEIMNKTHAKWEQVDVERKVVDELWVVRDSHEAHVWFEK